MTIPRELLLEIARCYMRAAHREWVRELEAVVSRESMTPKKATPAILGKGAGAISNVNSEINDGDDNPLPRARSR